MEFSDFIKMGKREPELQFLVIGGYAVGAHGHTRSTFDVDFMVCRDERDVWKIKATECGLKMFAESKSFAQFAYPEGGEGFDLMFVDASTFDKMFEASGEHDFEVAKARIPSLDHLLVLKLHALKQCLPHRTSKDAEDVEMWCGAMTLT